MPTITTTVTSAQATGAVTTVTTTEATPEVAASAAVPDWKKGCYNGKLFTVQFWTFGNADQKALFLLNYHDMCAAARNEGNTETYGYSIDTGALSLTAVWVWTEQGFLFIERLFAGNTAVAGLIGQPGFGTDSHWAGDITPALAAKIDTWDQAPGFSCKMTATVPSGRSIGNEIADGVGIIMHQTYGSQQERDAADAAFLPMQTVFNNGFSTMVSFDTSDTERLLVWFAESKEGLMHYFENLAHPDGQATMGASLPADFHGHWFGNTTDADINKEMAAWPTFSPCPMLCGSQGAAHIRFVQKCFFLTQAARDTWLASLNKTAKHAAQYIGFAIGDAGAVVVCKAKNMAECREFQANFSANAEALEALAACVALPTWNFGTAGAEWMTDVKGWMATYPALRWETGSDLVTDIWANGKENYDEKSLSFVQDLVCNTAEDLDAMVNLHNSGELYEAIQKAGANISIWKTSPTHALVNGNFPSAQAWLDLSPTAAKHGEFFMKAVKSNETYFYGDAHTPAVAASLAEWNQAPWCNAVAVQHYGMFGSN